MWNQLTKARSEYKSLGLESSLDYEKFAMISIVYNSTKIEGCSLDEIAMWRQWNHLPI